MRLIVRIIVILIIIGCMALSYVLGSWIPIAVMVSIPLIGLFFAFLIARPKNIIYIINPSKASSYQYLDNSRFDDEVKKNQFN